MFFSADNLFIIISILASITVYFQRPSELYLKLFPIYLLVSFAVDEVGLYMSFHDIHNALLYNIFSVFTFVFFFFIFHEVIQNPKMKRIVLYVIGIYPVVALLNIFFIQTTGFHSMTYALGCLLIVGIGIFYFFELFQLPHTQGLLRNPAFWIAVAVLFFYCGTFPFFGLSNFLRNAPRIIGNNLRIILMFINIFSYSLFTIAFLCRIRIRKSMSSS